MASSFNLLAAAPLLPLNSTEFPAYAIDRHLRTISDAKGRLQTIRSDLAEAMHQYRYGGATELRKGLVGAYRQAIFEAMRLHGVFDRLIVVPPLVSQPEYRRVIEFSSALCAFAAIASAQHWAERTSEKTFRLTSKNASLDQLAIVVIDDIYRSGQAMGNLCHLLRDEAKARLVVAVVGTVVDASAKPAAGSAPHRSARSGRRSTPRP